MPLCPLCNIQRFPAGGQQPAGTADGFSVIHSLKARRLPATRRRDREPAKAHGGRDRWNERLDDLTVLAT